MSTSEIVTLVISLVSLVLAGAAFGWQVLSWFLTGGRLSVQLRHGVVTPGGLVTRVVTRDGAVTLAGIDDEFVSRATSEVLAIEVVNKGRLPVVIESYAAELRDGRRAAPSFRPIGDVAGSRPLREELPPGHAGTWWVDMPAVDALVYAGQVTNPGACEVGMSVTLATGKTHRTRNRIRRPQAMR